MNFFSRRFWIIESIFIITFCSILYFNIKRIDTKYKNILIENNSYVVSAILKNNPELEDKVIETLLNQKGDTKVGDKILQKYGLDDITSYEYIGDISKLKEEIIINNFSLVCMFFLLQLILILYLINRQRKKIKELNDYLNKVLNGDYRVDIREYEEGDFSVLKNDIYKVTSLLKEKEQYSTNEKRYLESVLSDISHQIKTPLTSMYIINDILASDDLELSKKKELLQKNKNQLERIEWLVTSILKLSRLDSNMIELKKQNIKISSIIESSLEPLKIPIELKEQTIKINGDRDISIVCDINWTIEAILNILKNAHEHTPKKGAIEIDYIENPIYVEINIKDNGEGISREDLPNIFKRFYKGKSNKESIGIGLNMAKSIIEKQNGIINVESKQENGTKFIIKFYK